MILTSKKLEDACRSTGIDIAKYTHLLENGKFPNYPTEKYAHFLVMVELNDFAIFTQDGQSILMKETSEIIGDEKKITRGVMFQRKLTAALRRKTMSILRTYAKDLMELDNGQITEIKSINRLTPDSSLFGFAVGDSDDNKRPIAFAGKSRILSGSGFTVRPLSEEITKYITFNAQSDKTRIDEASTALGEKEFFVPEVFFPMILSLKDPTEEDIIFLTYVIDQTKRMGAVSTRSGHTTMHLCGLYLSFEDFPSNLELSQKIYENIGKKEKMPAISELCKIIVKSNDALLLASNIKSKFVPKDVVLTIYKDVFIDEGKIASWVKNYSAKYLVILLYLDMKNADLGRKEADREKEIKEIEKKVQEMI